MPIDLLNFPSDLLREVFRLCNPFELYKLSKCSKKCSQRSITLGVPKNWKISYWGGNDMAVLVDDSHYNFLQTDNPEDYFKTKLGRYTSQMNIEFPNGGAVDVFIYLIDIFGIRIVESLELSYCNSSIVSKVAKVLANRNITIEQLVIENYEEEQDAANVTVMLSQMNISQELSLKFPPDFHFQLVKYSRNIHITDSSWFTIAQLLDCACVRIDLEMSSLNNHDLDVFLQKWKKAGTFPNLRRLRIQSIQIDNKSPVQVIVPPIQNVNNPKIKISILNSSYLDIFDPVRVTKDDGTVGWLRVTVGNWSELNFLIANPADTVVEEIPE
ncbi:unnamed protein product [Caenorhabditis nigoni]